MNAKILFTNYFKYLLVATKNIIKKANKLQKICAIRDLAIKMSKKKIVLYHVISDSHPICTWIKELSVVNWKVSLTNIIKNRVMRVIIDDEIILILLTVLFPSTFDLIIFVWVSIALPQTLMALENHQFNLAEKILV